jgi:hypothetical protein
LTQDIILERLAGIKREYEELDTVWFMAGSLFKVFNGGAAYDRGEPAVSYR